MRHRDTTFVALGRFMAVERYCETCCSPSTDRRGPTDQPDTRGIAVAAARPRPRRHPASLPSWTSY
jgi:hypothetical protein